MYVKLLIDGISDLELSIVDRFRAGFLSSKRSIDALAVARHEFLEDGNLSKFYYT